jgi:O-succinylbenzoate synthase
VADADPYYSPETTRTAWDVLTRFLGPRVLGVALTGPSEVPARLAPVRGHRMAKAALEMAIWDAHARQLGVPLRAALGGTRTEIASGVSIGVQPSVEALLDRIAEEVEAGYQRVKIKIKPGWDVAVLEQVRRRFPALPLMVDANAAYTPGDAGHLRALDAFGLTMIEQPLDEEDLGQHARLQAALATPICLDESIHDLADAEAAMALGACRVLNLKQGRVGGLLESLRIVALATARGVPVWSGGMDETGIGRALNIQLQAAPGFTLPGDTSETRRYFREDIVEPPVILDREGYIAMPAGPGIGVAVVEERITNYLLGREKLR